MKTHIPTEYRLVSYDGKYLIEQRKWRSWPSRIFSLWGPWEETYEHHTGMPYKDATLSDGTAAMERLRQHECELRKDPVVLLTSLPTDCE